MANKDPKTAAENVGAAVNLFGKGEFSKALDRLRGRYPDPGPRQQAGPGDSYQPQTSPGDWPSHPRLPYPEVGYEPYYPYYPPVGNAPGDYPAPPPAYQPPTVAPGWYSDPVDGKGYRWWNGYGWTEQTYG